jgi:TolB-like protein/Tfp pilus assembly protein PilF
VLEKEDARAMSTTDPTWEPNTLTPIRIDLVRQHLKQVLASRAFTGSKRTQDFLQLIVGHALDGEVDSLRERMIGAEMFGRPINYDTGSDSVVRVKATEVRKRLAQFYLETEGRHKVRIEIPSGSYVPKFCFDPPETVAQPRQGSMQPAPVEHPAPAEDATVAPTPVTHTNAVVRPSLWKSRPRLLAGLGVALILCLATGAVAYKRWYGDVPALRGIRSIAILPLKNLSSDTGQEYFADGMTEELINDLGQVSTLRVISLTSSMSYKGTKKKLPEIARELAVDGVIEGGVLREGNQVRISVQLIDARTDRPTWAHTYVRDLTGTLAWQGEVAQAIAEEVSIKTTPQEQARLSRKRPIDPEAQDLFLHGNLLLDADNCWSAINYLHQALAKNPNYAEAHAALATCYGRLGETGEMAYQEAFSTQKSEAARAVALDESLPEGHAELANAAMTLDWDWATAASEFHRALELNPNSAAIHQKYAFFLVRTGQLREAVAEVERGVDLDPLSGRTFHHAGFIYYFARQYDDALSLVRRVRALDISPPDWSFLLGIAYAAKESYPDAIAAFQKAGDGAYALGHLGNAYARSGNPVEARKLIARLQENVRKNGVGRYEIALVYIGLGDKQQAFQWLEEAYGAHDVGMVYLKIDPCLDPLRSDPRFDRLMHRVGLTP